MKGVEAWRRDGSIGEKRKGVRAKESHWGPWESVSRRNNRSTMLNATGSFERMRTVWRLYRIWFWKHLWLLRQIFWLERGSKSQLTGGGKLSRDENELEVTCWGCVLSTGDASWNPGFWGGVPGFLQSWIWVSSSKTYMLVSCRYSSL